MHDLPLVTVGLPCLNEELYIEQCIRCVQGQDYPADRIEIFVADGGSTDKTLSILDRLAADDPRIHVLPNPGRIQSAGMNEIIRRAAGDVIIRLDVHGEYARSYVRKCIEVLQRTGADNVGGAARARARTWFQRALCAALDSPLGVGGSRYRSAGNEGFVDTVFNGAFRRAVFEKVGMYDPAAITNEDAELNQRILQAGGKIYLSREIEAWYYPRDTLRGLAKQYFKYGRGRARTLLKHKRLPSPRPLGPFMLVLSGSALLATSAIQPFTPLAFGLYASLCGVEAIRVGRKAGWRYVPVVWTIFPVMHVAHGIGVASGLVHYYRHPDWQEPERLPPRSTP